MSMTDPIADMLTRIRNANNAGHKTVEIPASNEKRAILKILLDEGYIKKTEEIDNGNQGIIKVTLKYGEDKSKVIAGLKRISKPGLRIYVGKEDVPKVLNGLGVAVMSTSQGVITDKAARKAGIGGEVVCYVW
ncbi:ribosomal protein S8 [Pseudoramibacter alactolyticus ATCC 23263]|jgi:small subunit ribosomal protein S8|uniref:Small ribosomal subunit protein uS8 n=1 Tax=Pseudoramibacter alactolyticus ATCC 23263 TaxID=887929 RepID=E6MHL2_9FIRM|nr:MULTISPECIES: 30S ribosomal protein S8 [Pseudoramibacter]EFV01443.1 ribosomal protein S8 [Pseudoramibacter alactolyticus ATCC 23263]MBM6969369.1 30S ribosomal protein S8 [Pseudoramibacter alactolyticus]